MRIFINHVGIFLPQVRKTLVVECLIFNMRLIQSDFKGLGAAIVLLMPWRSELLVTLVSVAYWSTIGFQNSDSR